MDNFITILIIIVVLMFIFEKKENFNSDTDSDNTNQNKSTGIYNYFFQAFMNPYPLPMNKFFSNDIQGNPQTEPYNNKM
jgi:hypothetical protein